MKALTVNNIKFEIAFDDEIEGTYIVSVTTTTKNNEGSRFYVNCQTRLTYDYKVSAWLTCSNESGSDIGDSGLADFLDKNGITGADYEEIVDAIEAEAQEQVAVNTVEDYLNKELCNEFTFEKGLAGACYAHNCSLYKYTSKDGSIVVVAEDSSENIPEEIIKKYREFPCYEDYSDWFDKATEGHAGHWSGDCSLALMLYKAL